MQPQRTKILVIGVSADEFERVLPFLARNLFEVDRFPSAAGSFELITLIPFEVLVVRYPLPDMDLDKFLQEVRRENSPCLKSSLLLLTTVDKVAEGQRFIGRGANRVVSLEEANTTIQQLITSLLQVAPRKDARFLTRVEVKIGGAKDMILCQTENISASGMLVRTDRRYDPGIQVSFEFSLPNDHRPVVGNAEIVRHTKMGRDKVAGIGLRFLSFEGDSQRRFQAFINSL